ncbi:hypothetical protein HMPREF9095_0681 [Haemophilus aegyptius ATCC 11116]|nr:hypothetical protein HMPREF9095_0681 [Haemophilus aegyptius ATCC 11116]
MLIRSCFFIFHHLSVKSAVHFTRIFRLSEINPQMKGIFLFYYK